MVGFATPSVAWQDWWGQSLVPHQEKGSVAKSHSREVLGWGHTPGRERLLASPAQSGRVDEDCSAPCSTWAERPWDAYFPAALKMHTF
jgi:hypothetical protein